MSGSLHYQSNVQYKQAVSRNVHIFHSRLGRVQSNSGSLREQSLNRKADMTQLYENSK